MTTLDIVLIILWILGMPIAYVIGNRYAYFGPPSYRGGFFFASSWAGVLWHYLMIRCAGNDYRWKYVRITDSVTFVYREMSDDLGYLGYVYGYEHNSFIYFAETSHNLMNKLVEFCQQNGIGQE